MAHWTDGPEYAPTERPDVFVEPDAPQLGHADPEPDAAPRPPRAEVAPPPHGFSAPDAPPLDALVPASAPERDPHEAFDVAATPMTSWSPATLPPPEGDPVPLEPPRMGPDGFPALPAPTPSAWGHAHAPQGLGRPAPPAWAPDQPFPPGAAPAPSNVPGPPPAWPPPQVNPGGFPQAGPAPWEQPPPQRAFEPVTLGTMLRNTTPAVLICLGLGAIVFPFSMAMLVLASVLATRIRYRRRIVGRMFTGSILLSFLLGMAGMFDYQGALDPLGWYDASTGWAQLACLILFVAVPLVVGDAMRRGEEPEQFL